ncbi:MAG: hypothetical protein RID07_08435, partial [Lacipirellulaceae bacterium]
MKRNLLAILTLALLTSSVANAAVIREFLPLPVTTTPGEWYLSDMRGAGTASIPDLTGLGGDLETNQPLPTGAALLTTDFNNGDKAEVGTFGNFGLAADVLTTGQIGYDYYKQTVASGNASAAPSIKLTLFAAGGTGDNFGTLVYEPTWNQPSGGSSIVPADAWQSVSIDSTTGSTDGTGTGGWWWTGGFGEANTAGGPPIRSLGEWASLFAANDPADFPNAQVVGISVGVGTFNQGQVGYFDKVSLSVPGGYNETFDFQAIPEPTS